MTRPPPDIEPITLPSEAEFAARRRRFFGRGLALLGGLALCGLALALAIRAARAEPVTGPITVIDGDTVKLATGEVIRLHDIDAPETRACTATLTRSCARCAREIDLGHRAVARLADELERGPVTIDRCEPPRQPGAAPRCKDQYGRTLGRLMVSGRSAGDTLIAAGLATRWQARRDWCGR